MVVARVRGMGKWGDAGQRGQSFSYMGQISSGALTCSISDIVNTTILYI